MNLLTASDVEFERQFASGQLSPQAFDHRAHLRLAYIHLTNHGHEGAAATFREALLGFLGHHEIDPSKFHETLTLAWLAAVWHFMQRLGSSSGSDDFLQKCAVLHDPKIMMTHYSRDVLFSEEARRQFVVPDLSPIPRGAGPMTAHVT
jgi:hypothetical protein